MKGLEGGDSVGVLSLMVKKGDFCGSSGREFE